MFLAHKNWDCMWSDSTGGSAPPSPQHAAMEIMENSSRWKITDAVLHISDLFIQVGGRVVNRVMI